MLDSSHSDESAVTYAANRGRARRPVLTLISILAFTGISSGAAAAYIFVGSMMRSDMELKAAHKDIEPLGYAYGMFIIAIACLFLLAAVSWACFVIWRAPAGAYSRVFRWFRILLVALIVVGVIEAVVGILAWPVNSRTSALIQRLGSISEI